MATRTVHQNFIEVTHWGKRCLINLDHISMIQDYSEDQSKVFLSDGDVQSIDNIYSVIREKLIRLGHLKEDSAAGETTTTNTGASK